MPIPNVTVLMPVYNAAPYLREAIESILYQTYTDFEFLIINDGSTDNSLDIISSYQDHRIQLIENDRNVGLITTLNKGLDLAKGRYIARMDADDISLPSRLEKQVAYLDHNPTVGLLGTWMEKFWQSRSEIIRFPSEHTLIHVMLAFNNAFGHNTMMMRRDFLEQSKLRYEPEFRHAEDYAFWVRSVPYTQCANVPEVLVRYRFHPYNTSHVFQCEQRETANRIRALRLIDALGIVPDKETLELHHSLMNMSFQGEWKDLKRARDWLSWVATQLAEKHVVSPELVYKQLTIPWYNACGRLAGRGKQVWELFRASPVGQAAHRSWHTKLLVRCMIRKPIPR